MKKLLLFIIPLMMFTSCATTKAFKMKYKVIEVTGLNDSDKHGLPTAYDAVIEIGYNYYSASISKEGKIIFIGDIVGNKKDGVIGEVINLCQKAWLKIPNTPNMLEEFDKWVEQNI